VARGVGNRRRYFWAGDILGDPQCAAYRQCLESVSDQAGIPLFGSTPIPGI
jgi:hypothetical protein